MRREYRQFFDEIFDHFDAKAVSLRLNRYTEFFVGLEQLFGGPEEIRYRPLFEHFGVSTGKYQAVPISYLIRRKLLPELHSSEQTRIAEQLRHERTLNRAKGSWFSQELRLYHEYMLAVRKRYNRRGWSGDTDRMVPNTITKNLLAANYFLAHLDPDKISNIRQLTQLDLDAFLAQKPGYASAVCHFVSYLNRKVKLFQPLEVVIVPQSVRRDAFLSQDRVRTLLSKWISARGRDTRNALIFTFMLLYAQKARDIVALKLSDFLRGPDGLYKVAFGKTEISLEGPVSALMDRYLAVRRSGVPTEPSWENKYLFPGRVAASHLSRLTVSELLRESGLNANQMFASAIMQAYLAGVRQPKVLVNAYGISLDAAIKYLQCLHPRLVDETTQKTERS